jgi:hypothetical protein
MSGNKIKTTDLFKLNTLSCPFCNERVTKRFKPLKTSLGNINHISPLEYRHVHIPNGARLVYLECMHCKLGTPLFVKIDDAFNYVEHLIKIDSTILLK